jgi:hypothetical protein
MRTGCEFNPVRRLSQLTLSVMLTFVYMSILYVLFSVIVCVDDCQKRGGVIFTYKREYYRKWHYYHNDVVRHGGE